ncbi:unnamed protein product [Lymnaea stagnalis]|uniref:Beta-1,3-galactosyl-O-glycosyl-glycoprotein beta-1,6-N-acetylglucosaminyltransferase n=1 Tax=Lymnaea stagnalis TaxID=6523 RepID=A0AAV2I9K1_LYMST
MYKSRSLSRKVSPLLNDDFYTNGTENCQRFKTGRGYVTAALTEEERDFPIAFSILTFKDAEMVERLLRAIYRPQNFYCIHVDRKAKDSFYFAMVRIAGCFENVFLTFNRIDVIWGTFSVLEPELICMAELWRHRKWKYFINLTGQEFPLKTNRELVRILKSFNGANVIHSTLKSAETKRWGQRTPPHHIRPVKGPVHIAANRRFVDYILHNQTALDFLQWTRHTDYPDETFFTSLNFNPHLGIPGSYSGDSDDVANVSLTRYKEWFGQGVRCAARRFVRGICILTTGDLPFLERSAALFANKFHLDRDRLVIACLEERLFNNTRDGLSWMTAFNTSFYEKQLFVTHQITAP